MSEIQKLDRTRLPRLRKVEKEELFTEKWMKTWDVKMKDEPNDVTDDNDLLYLGAALATKDLKTTKQKVKRNDLGGKDDWKFKLKIWGD